MKILALDFGTKNIGLALTDTTLDVIFPFGVIQNDQNVFPKDLIDVCKNERIEKVVIGLPLGLDGEETVNSKRVRDFADEFQKYISLSFEFFDERFSSHEADRMLGGASRDEKAAMIILETYLQKNK